MKGEEFLRRVRKCQGPLFCFLLRLLKDEEEAKEIMQATLLRAWEGRDGFQGRSQFKTWIFKIALNLFRDRLQERQRWQGGELPEVAAPSDPLKEVIAKEERQRLLQAIEGLPERQRTALLLKVYGELKYSEVAEVMGCSTGAAKAHFHHALYKLKEALRDRDGL